MLDTIYRPVSTYAGMNIIEDTSLVNTVEDWRFVRSPSRAARRRKQGHRQNIVYVPVPKPDIFKVGNALVMHPETKRQLLAQARTE